MLVLDHLAVAGSSLPEAVDHVETCLGVPLQPGGRHAHFATHNALLGLADGLYLEAIATDPAAQPKQSPRWFGLDAFSGPPRLSKWICRTEDLDDALAQTPVDAGAPVALARGALRWKMAVPASGFLPFDDLFPALMQWQGAHPAPSLTQQGCRLRRLVVTHPEAAEIARITQLNDARVVFEVGQPDLRAEIETPHGLRTLA